MISIETLKAHKDHVKAVHYNLIPAMSTVLF